MRKRAFLAAAILSIFAAPARSAKIDPRVVERAQSASVVPVFIVLAHQPQREILEQAESANALYRGVAESRYRQAAERAYSDAAELKQTREAAQAVLLRTRQQAFEAIERAVAPEQAALESRLRGLGAERISRYLGINMLSAEVPGSAIPALASDPTIAQVFPIGRLHAQLATSVPDLGAPAFWNAGYTGQGEAVGILDSGIRTNHPAFAGVPIVSQIFLSNGSTDPCFADNASSAQDMQGHGTHVAGIVASQGSAGWTNYQGVAKGIGTLYNLKVGYKLSTASGCPPYGAESSESDVLAALDWAVRNTPLKIFNYSYGSPTTVDDDGFTQAIDQYIDTYGLTITIAAGNGGLSGYGVTTPGIAYNGITVANWVSRGTMNPSSSPGPTPGGRFKPDLAAPGSNIYSAAANWDAQSGTSDDFVSMSGTSMAAPHIAGAAALLESAGVSSPLIAKAILINTADSAGTWAADSGWGYTNLNAAIGQMNYASDSLAADELRIYRVSLSGAFRATATWNRHATGGNAYFNDLNLYLCSIADSSELSSSTTVLQNVEQLSATYSGDALVAVTTAGAPLTGVDSEPYAVAFSSQATPLSGAPAVDVSCNFPASVASGSQFSLTCTANNAGSLTAYGVTGRVLLPAGFSAPAQVSFGDIQPGSLSSQGFNVTAAAVSGIYTIRLVAGTLCGLRAATATQTLAVTPALAAPLLLSPANGAIGVSITPTLSWSPSVGAVSYQVYLGSTPLPPLVSSTTGTTYTPPQLGTTTLYYWRVVAISVSGASSSYVSAFTTQGPQSEAEYLIATVAGGGTGVGDGGPAINAALTQPPWVAVDQAGELYIADTFRRAIRKVTPDGIINTVAGGGYGSLGDGGPALGAFLWNPSSVSVDGAGNFYIGDGYSQRIRRVGTNGIITTVAGTDNQGYTGDGGPATLAQLDSPGIVMADSAGNLYIPDSNMFHVVRKVGLDGIINTIVGNRVSGATRGFGGDGGPAVNARLNSPTGMAVDTAGNLYIADLDNNRIRMVTPNGIISTVAGNGIKGYAGDGGPAVSAELSGPVSVGVDQAGNLYIADTSNFRIRRVDTSGTITTIAGSGVNGFSGDGGPATSSEFSYVGGIAVTAGGNVYFADTYNNVIRALLRPASSSCRYQVALSAVGVSGAGGTLPVSIQTSPSCPWNVSDLPAWVTATAAGVGPTNVNLTVAANSGPLRAATISVAGNAVTVTQADFSCAYALGSSSASYLAGGGPGSVEISTGPGCVWSVSTPLPWVALSGATYGSGSGTINYAVATNIGVPRSATLSIAGLPFTIQQGGTPAGGYRFLPLAPCRVADTRFEAPSLAANSSRSFALPLNCGLPSYPQAYSLNVTAVPKGPLSYLTLWPTGEAQPFVSTLNSLSGDVVANAAIVPAGTDGAISVYATDATDVILDINGYFESATGPYTYSFYPVQPCRVADTRNAAGPLGGPSMFTGQSRDFPLPSSPCSLPSTAGAYSMNVTVVPNGYLGYLTTWPTGQSQPLVSTLNSWTGKIVANAAIVPAGSGGSTSVFVSNPTDVVLDINGYFGAQGGAGSLSFYPVPPCRIADTRNAVGPLGGPEMEAQDVRSFPVPSSACGIPATAAAYSLNVTVVPDGMLSYLTAWPTGAAQPFVSTLNSLDGSIVANAAIVPAGAGGAISVYVTDRTHVVLDINGYFAP